MKLLAVFFLVSVAFAVQWDPDEQLTNNQYSDFDYWSCQRRVAVDPEGRIHLVWYVMNSGLGTYRFQVYYKRYNPGTGWSQDTMLSADLYAANTYSKHPAIACDSNGAIHAAWGNGPADGADDFIYYKSCRPAGSGNGGWDAASTLLSGGSTVTERSCPNLSATPDGHVHAVWLEVSGGTQAIAYRERIDTVWQTQVDLEPNGYYKVYPAVAGGRDNNVHVVWHGRNSPSGYYNIWYKARVGGSWGALENASDGVRHQMYPSLAISPATNQPHALWQGQEASGSVTRTIHGYRTGGGWQPRDTLSEPGVSYAQGTGQIIFTSDGLGHALWQGKSEEWPTLGQIRYSGRDVAGIWSEAVNVTDTGGSRDRAAVMHGGNSANPNDLHVMWTDYRTTNSEIFYKHGRPGGSPVEEASQSAAGRLPAAMVRGRFDSPGTAVLVDASGRPATTVRSGPNRLDGLAPGVYLLYPIEGGVRCRKLVIVE